MKHSQAQAFYDMVQSQLKDPNFQGIMFPDGAILAPLTLRSIRDPDVLLQLCARIADHNDGSVIFGQN